MKKIISLLIVIVFTFIGCNKSDKNSTSGDASFEKISEEFLNGYLEWRTQTGVSLG